MKKSVDSLNKKRKQTEKRKARKQAQKQRKSKILNRQYIQREKKIEEFEDEILVMAEEFEKEEPLKQSSKTDLEEFQFQQRYNEKGPWSKIEKSILPDSQYAKFQSTEEFILCATPEDMEFA